MFNILKSVFGGGSDRVTPEQAKQLMDQGAVVIDVREPGEIRSTGKVKGAINIPVSQIASRANEFSPEKTIIVYCASGMRSGSAASTLRTLGHQNVVNLGGFGGWAASGGAIERG